MYILLIKYLYLLIIIFVIAWHSNTFNVSIQKIRKLMQTEAQKPSLSLSAPEVVPLPSRDCGVQHGNHQASGCLNYQLPKLVHQSAQSNSSNKT